AARLAPPPPPSALHHHLHHVGLVLTVSAPNPSGHQHRDPAAEAKLERLQPLQWPTRDELCDELGAGDAGRCVRLCGWVALHRAHAGLTFLILRPLWHGLGTDSQ
ncbi:Os01g0571700, partial [Oryza sativa Japonica Group]